MFFSTILLQKVCQEAALGPIRELGAAALRTVKAEDVRNLNEQVFGPSSHCADYLFIYVFII